MLTCDKQNEIFITQQKQRHEAKSINAHNAIISHNNSRLNSKFNRTNESTNAPTIMADLPPVKAQTHQMTQLKSTANISCIMEQKQLQEQKLQHTFFKYEVSRMTEKALKKIHMTLKEYLQFSNNTANSTNGTTTNTNLATSKTANKNMHVQHREQDVEQTGSHGEFKIRYSCEKQHQPTLRPAFDNITTDPVNVLPNLATISSSSSSPSQSSCTLFLTPTPTPPPPPPLSTTTITTQTLQDTRFNVAAIAEALTIPATADVVENAQRNTQECKNVCVSLSCGSKQKFTKQQKTKRQKCKSANVSASASASSSKNNTNNIRTVSITNINNHHTDDNADGAISSITAAVEGTTKSNNTNATSPANKANVRLNTISTTTNTTIATATTTHTGNLALAGNVATRPTEPTEPTEQTEPTMPAATRATHCKAFPIRQRCYQNNTQLECLLRALVFSFMFVVSMQYQTVSASSSMMSKHEPMFISRSETFKFVAGDTIILPCEVANTDPYVVAWKRGIAILTAGSVKVTPDPRVRLVSGFNLQIRDAVPQDAGDYICQIATMEPREITHTVEILVPPRIHHISTSGHLQVKKGSSVRIECSASGNPTPNVTWSRKNNILPNGEEKLHSHILSIENVDRHKGGVYICTANNGVGQPASSQVVLHVLYPPEITVERPVVFSGEGHEAMLVCIVHGETQPEVIWFKDTMQLDTTERHIMENRGSRHTLIIRKVHPQDFGNYSCVAENQLGKSRKTLQLSGKPNVAVFNSPPISQYKDRYNISWTVESHTPIEEYKLSFRRLQQGQEVDNSIDSHSSSSSSLSSSMLQMYGSGSSVNAHNYRLGGISSLNSMSGGGGYGSYGAGNVMHWGRNDWRDVVLPAIPTSHHYTQGMSYMIRGLDPDQHYEATVQARNRYGWSDYSQSFVFSTSSNDNEMRDLSVTFYGSKATHLESSCFLPLIICAASLRVLDLSY